MNAQAGYALVIAAAVLWGALGVLSRFLTMRGIAPLEIAFWRAALGGAFFACETVYRRASLPRSTDLAATAAFGLVGVAVFYAAYQLAVASGGASLASVLLYTAPAFVAVLAPWVLRERAAQGTTLLVIVTVTGVALVSLAGGTRVIVSVRSVGWGLTSGLAYALYYLFGKTVIARRGTAPVLAIALPLGAVGLLPLVRFAHKDAAAWGLLVVISFASTYLANTAYMAGLQRLHATRAAVVACIEPLVATMLAALLLGERLAPTALVGASMVVLAVAWTSASKVEVSRGEEAR